MNFFNTNYGRPARSSYKVITRCMALFVLACCLSTAGAQTLFSFGKHTVSRDEFLRAYQRNNHEAPTDSSLQAYLELYIRFKLKVQAARDQQMDTLPGLQADLQSFRRQIESPYLTDAATLRNLTDEAFRRSQTDIRLSHIYLPFKAEYATSTYNLEPVSAADSLALQQKLESLQRELAQGKPFASLAQKYSADLESAKRGGDIGYVTVFTLPYTMESAVYGLKDQQISQPLASKAGFHFFQKTAERQAAGRMKLAQILIAIPPGSGPEGAGKQKRLADSIRQALVGGASFETLALQYSHDRNTYLNGGIMPEHSTGQYDPAFEAAAYSLKTDGAISDVVETTLGYHILKRLAHTPVETDRVKAEDFLKKALADDPRTQLARQKLEETLPFTTGYKTYPFNRPALWAMTDSMVLKNKRTSVGSVHQNTRLFGFEKEDVKASAWLDYVRSAVAVSTNGQIDNEAEYQKFVRASTLEYYRNHLEDYDSSYAMQIREFKDGLLLFQVMEKEVWEKASRDSAGLAAYFRKNQSAYHWGPSAEVLIVSGTERSRLDAARNAVEKNPSVWRNLAEQSDETLLADSGRYEISQLAVGSDLRPTDGTLTPLMLNDADQTWYFHYFFHVLAQPAPRSFEDARGLVINDYQQVLEEEWLKTLRKKYPVKLNQTSWKSVQAAARAWP